MNRLIQEKSPYLLQHANNPVDWYPWGEEAFNRARLENKPIFLSIGYSTCHWCHVMERESFEDGEIARLLNHAFINIKVDREERADIDHVYMDICQMLTGSGGWPLTIIMTPDKKPFFAGTYFPKISAYGRIGMIDLIPRIDDLWKNRQEDARNSADVILAQIHNIHPPRVLEDANDLSFAPSMDAVQYFKRSYDQANGGFGSAPKFPTPHSLLFLLTFWHRTKDENVLQMVLKTLQSMRSGGIYDHLGYGFSRYSTDSNWLVPHFEKMLYDQALLILAYTEAYQATRLPEFRKTAEEIIDYVLRDMTDPEGGFYSAEDADSEGVEGKFYLWERSEIVEILGADNAELFCRGYGVKNGGNFSDPAGHSLKGANILHLSKSEGKLAEDLKMDVSDLITLLSESRSALFKHRENRIHPHKDDKILTDWNSLMIAALAKAGRVFSEHHYIKAAKRAVHFIQAHLLKKEGRLLHRYRAREAVIDGNLDDYAFLIWGLLELYEADYQVSWLHQALELNQVLLARFRDPIAGDFFFTADDAEALPIRLKRSYDGAIPCGNSVQTLNLLRLASLTGTDEYEELAQTVIRANSEKLIASPANHAMMLVALERALAKHLEIVLVTECRSNDAKPMLKVIDEFYLPHKTCILIPEDRGLLDQVVLPEFRRNMTCVNGKTTAYVCVNKSCRLPTNQLEDLRRHLSGY
jgi:uncharacterized protein